MDLQKLLKIIAIAIGVISIIFLINIIATGNDAIKAGQSESSIGIYMYLAYKPSFAKRYDLLDSTMRKPAKSSIYTYFQILVLCVFYCFSIFFNEK